MRDAQSPFRIARGQRRTGRFLRPIYRHALALATCNQPFPLPPQFGLGIVRVSPAEYSRSLRGLSYHRDPRAWEPRLPRSGDEPVSPNQNPESWLGLDLSQKYLPA